MKIIAIGRREQLPVTPVKATKKVKKAAAKVKEDLVKKVIEESEQAIVAEEVKAERLEESTEDAPVTTE
tara:strand:- start:44179 stop:44385 length:207 start_codon:yes stop_codon:yes gene_type:complete